MKNSIGTTNWWGFFIWMTIMANPLFSQITVDQFMGANMRGQDPINRMDALGIVREFHPWAFNEGFPSTGNASPDYPNNQYKWNPNYIDFIRYDDFYSEIGSQNINISPVTIRSIPQITDPFLAINPPFSDNVLNVKPILAGADPLLPSSYEAHGAYLYHYIARYGNTIFFT